MIKRSGVLLNVLSDVISHMLSIQFKGEVLKMLTDDLIKEELLVNQEYSEGCCKYFSSLASMINETEAAEYLIIKYL